MADIIQRPDIMNHQGLVNLRCGAYLGRLCLAGVIAFALLLSGCDDSGGAYLLSAKAKEQWEAGHYADAARNFATLAEVHPDHELAGEALFWAANLYQYYLNQPEEAIRYYQEVLVRFPNGEHALNSRENLASLFEQDKRTRHRALQTYQQLLLAEELKNRRDEFQFKIASLNLKMGVMDQSRYEFRRLITEYPNSELLPEAYYLVGYSYFLEERHPLAVVAFRDTAKLFPKTKTANRALFFIAEILEEQGKLKEALREFRNLKGKYHNEKILDKRIRTLQSRMRKGVR